MRSFVQILFQMVFCLIVFVYFLWQFVNKTAGNVKSLGPRPEGPRMGTHSFREAHLKHHKS